MYRTNAIRTAREHLLGLPLFAQALAGDLPVRLLFDGSLQTAATDGNTIWIGRIPLPTSEHDSETLNDTTSLLYGLTCHELGHKHFSDFEVVKRAGRLSTAQPRLFGCFNALEDPRQETKYIAALPGVRHWLDALNEVLYRRYPPDLDNGSIGHLVDFAANTWLYTELRGDPNSAPFAEQAMERIGDRLSVGVRQRLIGILELHGMRMTSSEDALACARRIQAMLKDEEDRVRQQAEQARQQEAKASDDDTAAGADDATPDADAPDGGDAADDDVSADESDGDESDDDESEDGDPGTDSDPQQPGDSEEASDDAEPGTDPSTAGEPEGNGASGMSAAELEALAEALAATVSPDTPDALQDKGDQAREAIDEVSSELEAETPCTVMESPPVGGDDDTLTHGVVLGGPAPDTEAALAATAALRSGFTASLQAMARVRVTHHLQGRRLDVRRMPGLNTGNVAIFQDVHRKRATDAAVVLAADVSGSMSGSMQLLADALFATSVALDGQKGVSLAVITFPGFGLVKGFNQRSLAMPGQFALASHGFTPMTEGLVMAGRLLLPRRERRKIVVTLTDGGPDNLATAIGTRQLLERQGIETFGIGIGAPSVAHVFPRSDVIGTISDLAPRLIGLLRGELLAA